MVASTTARSARLDTVATRERDELVDALSRHAWQVARTADALRVHRVTLSRRMGRLGIKRPPRYERELPVVNGDAVSSTHPIDEARMHGPVPEASRPDRDA